MHARPQTIAPRCSRAHAARCKPSRYANPVFHPLPHASPTAAKAGNARLIVLAARAPISDFDLPDALDYLQNKYLGEVHYPQHPPTLWDP
jgi:hypothetical protein